MLSTGLRQAQASSLSFIGSRIAMAGIGAANGLHVEALIVTVAALLLVAHRINLLRHHPPVGLDWLAQRPIVRTMELNCALNSAISLYVMLAIENHVPDQEGLLIIVILALSLTVAGQYTALIGRCFPIYTIPHLLAIGLAGLLGPPLLAVVAVLLLPLLFITLRRSAIEFRELVEHSIGQRLALADTNAALVEARDGAEAANRAKTQFLASMSHEIRTPLNGVLGTLDLLRHSALDHGQRHMVETAAQSGAQLLHVLNEILDLSKIEAGRVELDPTAVAPASLAQEAVDLFSASARTRQIALGCELAPDLPAQALLDAARVRQVLLNLVGNALKFTERGRVLVRVQRLARDPSLPDWLRFEVCDTGIGMPPEAVGRLFEPFTQVDQSNRRRHGGSGLGLAISRRLAEAMGGALTADSRAGIGSTFRLDLPLVPPDAEQAASAAAAPLAFAGPATVISVLAGERPAAPAPACVEPATIAPAGSPQVLVVEDNAINRLLVGTMLARLDVTVTEAEDGETACMLARQHRFDLILMDCQMPGMDGFATTAGIRAEEIRRGLAPVPIVALTASAMPGDADACLRAGMDGYLAKPYTLDQLDAAIAPWLGRDDARRRA